MNILIESGSPKNIKERSQSEQEVYRLLTQLNLPFERADHDALFSMESYSEIEKTLKTKVPKNLFLCNRQKTKFYLLLMPGEKTFKTKELSNQINSARLSFASEEDLQQRLHCYKGSTSLFGLLFDEQKEVNLLIDKDLLTEETLSFHPCENTSTIKLKTKDILNILLPALKEKYTDVALTGK